MWKLDKEGNLEQTRQGLRYCPHCKEVKQIVETFLTNIVWNIVMWFLKHASSFAGKALGWVVDGFWFQNLSVIVAWTLLKTFRAEGQCGAFWVFWKGGESWGEEGFRRKGRMGFSPLCLTCSHNSRISVCFPSDLSRRRPGVTAFKFCLYFSSFTRFHLFRAKCLIQGMTLKTYHWAAETVVFTSNYILTQDITIIIPTIIIINVIIIIISIIILTVIIIIIIAILLICVLIQL